MTLSALAPQYTRGNAPGLDNFKTVSIEDVIMVVRASPSKQCAFDPLPTWLLKEAITILAPYITTIFNSLTTEEHFLQTWRHTIVTWLLKKAGLDKSSLVSDAQSAYRRYHSTETAVFKVFSDIINAISNGKIALLSLLDLTAAFDTVDHDILLRRLEVTYSFNEAYCSGYDCVSKIECCLSM